MLGIVIKVMRNILIGAAKRVAKTFSFSTLTGIVGRRTLVHARRFGTKMLTNMKSAKWWSRAIRYVRKSGLVNKAGSTGEALKQAGATNWIQRGLSAFKYDSRSPKEYQADFESKTKMIESLKKKRDDIEARALKVQDELAKSPLDTSKIPDPGAKIDALAASINQMKYGLADIKMKQTQTLGGVTGLAEDQSQANKNLGEVMLKTSEGVQKVQLAGFEDMRNHNMGLHAETAENITADITSHIDALEEQRKAEEEDRKKNDWKRKLFENILLILEWVLDFPTKIKMLLFKIGLVLVAGIAAVVLKYWTPIKNFLVNAWTRYFGYFKMCFNTILGFLYKIGNAISGFVIPIVRFIGNAVSTLVNALPGDWTAESKYIRDKFESVAKWMEELKLEDKSRSAFSKADEGMNEMLTGKTAGDSIKDKSTAMESAATKVDSNNPKASIVDPGKIVSPQDEKVKGSKKQDSDKNDPSKVQIKTPVPSNSNAGKKPKTSDLVKSEEKLISDTKSSYSSSKYSASATSNTTSTSSSTAKVDMSSAKTETVAVAKSDAATKEDLKSVVEIVNAGQKNIKQSVASVGKATVNAAGSRPPINNKTEYNFKKKSSELTTDV